MICMRNAFESTQACVTALTPSWRVSTGTKATIALEAPNWNLGPRASKQEHSSNGALCKTLPMPWDVDAFEHYTPFNGSVDSEHKGRVERGA